MPLNVIKYDATKNIPLIGIDRAWADVTSSRSANTTYTNTLHYPIEVTVMTYHQPPGGTILLVDGVRVSIEYMAIGDGRFNNLRAALTAIIPSGSTYRIEAYPASTIGTIENWSELR